MNRITTHPLSITRLFSAIQGNLEQRAYSPQTIKAYLGQLRHFVRDKNLTNPQNVSSDDIKAYLEGLVEEGKSRSTVDQAYNALSYFFMAVYNHDLILEGFKRPRKKKLKPVVLTVSEVRKIAISAENLKHRLMIELAYTAGLRVSELVVVKVQHMNLDKLMLFVPGLGKLGARTTIFSGGLKDALQRQVGNKKPGDYLFPSERGGNLTTRSVTKFFKNALTSSGVEKQVTPHSLRQSFTAFMLAKGTDRFAVQTLLGRRAL
jgi:site-specific recombinase XerD